MLDKTRSYCDIFGSDDVRFYQDGINYDADGNEVKGVSLLSEPVLIEMCEIASKTPLGIFAELGVYRGGSAKRLAEVARKQGRELHLFDTFTGIPFRHECDQHDVGDFSDTKEQDVRDLIPDAIFHVGIFPETMPKKLGRIAFLHIDADQYQSYKDAIRLFSPLMVSGGVMWFDDYECLASATKAVNESFGGMLTKSNFNKYYMRF